ncbi:hypothetical protein H9Q16_16945 [Sulfitobacter sp. TSTF-M16]|uniref:Peptidase inhibitor I78 family protein n=2 Tax=Sulfitobacter aestuariivivens TaxID=2766981 RepID=A0A927D8C4_9RHOB|nr:I78 family peptidase inhibitor [Sulfitobacter aestuariivivens]MBD3665624.1 hypothetical protein [Sulfitobacter aestuariivivens]
MKTGILIAGALLLAGCGAPGGSGNSGGSAPRVSGDDTCGASAYAGLIGQDAVVALSIPDPKRSYRPDEVVTSDFNPERVSIQLDETDVIVAIACG